MILWSGLEHASGPDHFAVTIYQRGGPLAVPAIEKGNRIAFSHSQDRVKISCLVCRQCYNQLRAQLVFDIEALFCQSLSS